MKPTAGVVERFKPPRFADHLDVNARVDAGIAERCMELLSGQLSDCDFGYWETDITGKDKSKLESLKGKHVYFQPRSSATSKA